MPSKSATRVTATTDQSKRAAALPPEERRAAIIEAVRPLLIAHGESITTRQIAAAAGIAEGTIFRVFADKDELLDATLEAALDPEPLENALRSIDRDRPLDDVLIDATEAIQRRVVDVWTLVSRLGHRRHEHARPGHDNPALTEIFAAHAGELSVEPQVAARMLRALTLSLTHPLLSDRTYEASHIVAVILHGVTRNEHR